MMIFNMTASDRLLVKKKKKQECWMITALWSISVREFLLLQVKYITSMSNIRSVDSVNKNG